MKQTRILMALCCLLLTAQAVCAQKNMWMVDKNKKAYCVPTDSVSYGTFNSDSIMEFHTRYEGILPPGTYTTHKDTIGNFGFSIGMAVERHQNKYFKNWKLAETPEVGVCYSSTNPVPTLEEDYHEKASCGLGGTFWFKRSLQNPGTTYYYRAYVKLAKNVVLYSQVDTVKTLGRTIKGHRFLDLGLPSGKLWAETNVGAATATDYGGYYYWGDTDTAKVEIDDRFTGEPYKYFLPAGNSYSKYNDTDGKTELMVDDDAAWARWGICCRMPTKEEFEELINNCTWEWKEEYSGKSVYGFLVTSKTNGKSIFLPAYGGLGEGTVGNGTALYWSSSLSNDKDENSDCTCASALDCDALFLPRIKSHSRHLGYQIRPVLTIKGVTNYDNHDFVDLGLPSGLLWAETNVGAETATDEGLFFAWSDTTAAVSSSEFTPEKHPYHIANKMRFSKYNETDSLTELENSDDAAYVNWGSYCHMPTEEEFQELVTNTKINSVYGNNDSIQNSDGEYIYGRKFVSKTTGDYLFLPDEELTEHKDIKSYHYMITDFYWSRNLSNSDASTNATNWETNKCPYVLNKIIVNENRHRVYRGRVRAVADPEP